MQVGSTWHEIGRTSDQLAGFKLQVVNVALIVWRSSRTQKINFSTCLERYFASASLFFFASARRSVFLRRALRFLTLSLPWLFPISPNTHLSRAGSKLFHYVAKDNPYYEFWQSAANRKDSPSVLRMTIEVILGYFLSFLFAVRALQVSRAAAFENVDPCRPRFVACPFSDVGSKYRDDKGLSPKPLFSEPAVDPVLRRAPCVLESKFQPVLISRACYLEGECGRRWVNLPRIRSATARKHGCAFA